VKIKERRGAGGHAGPQVHGVLKCKNCSTVWNRDELAAKNIRHVFLYMAVHNNRRPPNFERSENNEEN
jgi:transposase